MLDGLELASAGAHRLDTACVVGPEGLLRAIALDLEPVLRAAHLTPAADARELRALFGVIESLSLIAQGLAAAGKALASAGTARSKADG